MCGGQHVPVQQQEVIVHDDGDGGLCLPAGYDGPPAVVAPPVLQGDHPGPPPWLSLHTIHYPLQQDHYNKHSLFRLSQSSKIEAHI